MRSRVADIGATVLRYESVIYKNQADEEFKKNSISVVSQILKLQNMRNRKSHKVYNLITVAYKEKHLIEPFTCDDFRKACPGLGEGTYNAFLYKHRLENPGKNTELFKRVAVNKFILLRPFKYNSNIKDKN